MPHADPAGGTARVPAPGCERLGSDGGRGKAVQPTLTQRHARPGQCNGRQKEQAHPQAPPHQNALRSRTTKPTCPTGRDLRISESLHARRIRCNDQFGVWDARLPPCLPSSNTAQLRPGGRRLSPGSRTPRRTRPRIAPGWRPSQCPRTHPTSDRQLAAPTERRHHPSNTRRRAVWMPWSGRSTAPKRSKLVSSTTAG